MKRYTGKTTTAIIPYPNNQILLIKRKTPPFIGFWALPGGRVDYGETVEQTVVREVKEETNLDAVIERKIGEYVEKGIKDDVDYEYYPTCFLMRVVGGEMRGQESEILEIKPFSLNALPKLLAFEHELMIADYVKIKK
jgi:8-oxo-dGTP diphosphatase